MYMALYSCQQGNGFYQLEPACISAYVYTDQEFERISRLSGP
jgi:hypothetical protein